MVELFLEGGPFMWPILLLLLAGLGLVGERFYSLLSSSIDTPKFFEDVEETLNNHGVESALELSNNTDGPVAQIFVAGFPLPSYAVPISFLRFLEGKVIANARVAIPDGYQLLYSNLTLPYISAGVVFNSREELVGIHGRAE